MVSTQSHFRAWQQHSKQCAAAKSAAASSMHIIHSGASRVWAHSPRPSHASVTPLAWPALCELIPNFCARSESIALELEHRGW